MTRSPQMEIRFVRTLGAPDRVYVRRGDGSEVSWKFPTYGDALPHDLVHLVVETGFRLREGFWGRVDGGVDPERLSVIANRTVGGLAEKYAGFGPDLSGLYLAEALAGARWLDLDATAAERKETIERLCAGYAIPVPDFVTEARLGEIGDALDGLRPRWRALTPKGALIVRVALGESDLAIFAG